MLRAYCLALLLLPMGALAADSDEPEFVPPANAIQERHLRMQHEILISVGAMPGDPYTKTFFAQGSYTIHFTDSFAWQVARGGAGLSIASGLRTQLERDFGRLPNEFDSVQFFAGSDLIWSPLYGKLSLLDKALIHGELYVLGGASLLKFQYSFRPGIDVGLGMRIFMNRVLSLRLEIMDTVALPFAGAPGFVNVFSASVGLSINLGATE